MAAASFLLLLLLVLLLPAAAAVGAASAPPLLGLYTVLMLCSIHMVKMACERLDCSFSSVPLVARVSVPASRSRSSCSALSAVTSRAPVQHETYSRRSTSSGFFVCCSRSLKPAFACRLVVAANCF